MALPANVETFTIKNAQMYKKRLQIAQLPLTMAAELVEHQAAIAGIQADYDSQASALAGEISALEADIKALALG